LALSKISIVNPSPQLGNQRLVFIDRLVETG
jgi:hypothetical protein